MQNKQIESRLGRDYDVVKGLLEDICLRGYRTKEYYNRIGIENKTFDYHLRWIKSMLGEQNVVCERKNNGKIIFFRNKPLELQNNPLAEVFRHSVPNRDDFFFLFVILQFFNMPNVKKATVTDICYYIEESYSKKADRALVEQVRRRLEELEWSKIVRKIESRTEENQIEYELRPVIWKEFTYDELQKLYEYLSFLRNIMPFELPYMLLHENLDLWLRINYKDKYEEMQKEIFLFSHRNPTNVLQSEIIYTMLSNIKSKQQYREWIHAHHKRVLITKASFRAYDGIKFKTSKTKKEFKATYNRNGKFKRLNDKVKVARYLKIYSLQKNVTSLEMEVQTEDVKKYAIDMSNMEIERLLYDCNTGRILGKIAGNSNEDTNRVNLEGLHLYAPILHGEMIGAKRSLIKDAYAVFHYQNNIYMERLIELTYQEKKHWKKEELYDYFFRVPTPYKDIINSLFPIKKKSPEDDNTLFVYDQKKEEYSWQTPQVFSVFFVPRLALEAFVSLPQIAYTDMFFEHDTELVNKVKRIISRGHLEGECSWNIGDIEYLNRHACEEKNGYSIHSLLRRYRMNGCIYDKTREKYYYMLRLEYSVAKERVRVLGQEIGGEEKLTLIDSSNIEYKNCREFSRENLMKARRNYVEKVQNYKGVMQFKLEKSIEQLSVAMDHILSKDWMNLLASYEHETNYEFPEDKKDASEEKKRKFGIYEVKLWYWKEDEDEVVEELKKFNSVFKMVDDEPNIL